MLTLICLLVGAVLGRFKILVLVPATLVALIVVTIIHLAGHETSWPILGAGALAATSLQVGYLIGACTQHVMAVLRIRRKRSRSFDARATYVAD